MPHDPQTTDAAEVERLQSQVTWWSEQAADIERDRRHLQWWLFVCPAIVVALWGWWGWRPAAIGLAVGILTYAQGMYLVTVHRWEYAHNLREARRDLWLARKKLASSINTPAPPALTAWGTIHTFAPDTRRTP